MPQSSDASEVTDTGDTIVVLEEIFQDRALVQKSV